MSHPIAHTTAWLPEHQPSGFAPFDVDVFQRCINHTLIGCLLVLLLPPEYASLRRWSLPSCRYVAESCCVGGPGLLCGWPRAAVWVAQGCCVGGREVFYEATLPSCSHGSCMAEALLRQSDIPRCQTVRLDAPLSRCSNGREARGSTIQRYYPAPKKRETSGLFLWSKVFLDKGIT